MTIEKQADSLMRLSEKCYGTVMTGALGAPAFHWLQTSRQGAVDGAFISYAVLLVAGTLAAILLQIKAKKLRENLSR